MPDDRTALEVKLDVIAQDVRDIKSAVYGNGDNDGLKLDVDRLKRSRATHNAVLWVIFTGVVTIGGTVAAAIITQNF